MFATNSDLAVVLFSSLRIAPALTFAPPFTLMRIPAAFRVLLALGLSFVITRQVQAAPINSSAEMLGAIANELLLGLLFAWVLQAAFAALQIAGRTLDIQSGQSFATVLDPSSRTVTPLTGQLFALGAGMSFFAHDGHTALVRVFAQSYWAVPFGALQTALSLPNLLDMLSGFLLFALTFAAAPMLALFVTDAVVAVLSRTAPQINPLILGIQIKSLVLLLALFVTFASAGAFFNRFNTLLVERLGEVARP